MRFAEQMGLGLVRELCAGTPSAQSGCGKSWHMKLTLIMHAVMKITAMTKTSRDHETMHDELDEQLDDTWNQP